MKQSDVYALEEANNWYNRVGKEKRFYHAEYILDIFSRRNLCRYDILECGCSGGSNLLALNSFVNSVYGMDLSSDGIKSLEKKGLKGVVGNIADPKLKVNKKFDIVMLPMVAMYISDDEFEDLHKNVNNLVSSRGFIYISDFIVRESKININQHDKRIKIFKRNLEFYMSSFQGFDLIEYKQIDYNRLNELKETNDFKINHNTPTCDNDWGFISIWQKKV